MKALPSLASCGKQECDRIGILTARLVCKMRGCSRCFVSLRKTKFSPPDFGPYPSIPAYPYHILILIIACYGPSDMPKYLFESGFLQCCHQHRCRQMLTCGDWSLQIRRCSMECDGVVMLAYRTVMQDGWLQSLLSFAAENLQISFQIPTFQYSILNPKGPYPSPTAHPFNILIPLIAHYGPYNAPEHLFTSTL